jgi:hypothetical protein
MEESQAVQVLQEYGSIGALFSGLSLIGESKVYKFRNFSTHPDEDWPRELDSLTIKLQPSVCNDAARSILHLPIGSADDVWQKLQTISDDFLERVTLEEVTQAAREYFELFKSHHPIHRNAQALLRSLEMVYDPESVLLSEQGRIEEMNSALPPPAGVTVC